MPPPHVAGGAVIPLQNGSEKMLVFLENLSYTSLEIGPTRIFDLRPWKISQFFKFLEKSEAIKKNFSLRFCQNPKYEILMTKGCYT